MITIDPSFNVDLLLLEGVASTLRQIQEFQQVFPDSYVKLSMDGNVSAGFAKQSRVKPGSSIFFTGINNRSFIEQLDRAFFWLNISPWYMNEDGDLELARESVIFARAAGCKEYTTDSRQPTASMKTRVIRNDHYNINEGPVMVLVEEEYYADCD